MFSKTVVVGVDGSPESRAALRFALADARRRGAQVRAVTAYLSPEYWAASYGLSALPTIEEVVEDNVIVAREALQAETDLDGDLPVGHRALGEVAAHLDHLEPVDVAQRLVRACDGVADRGVDAVRRRPDELGDAVGVVGHGFSSGRGVAP